MVTKVAHALDAYTPVRSTYNLGIDILISSFYNFDKRVVDWMPEMIRRYKQLIEWLLFLPLGFCQQTIFF